MMELKDLIAIPSIADRLRPPIKADKVPGPRKESWCEFHEAFGHHINNCLALGYQLDELVKNGFLKDYLMEKQAGRPPGSQPGGSEGQQHEAPVLGEIHTIAGGFSGGGCTASQRKRYARSVMSVEVFEDNSPDVDITFTKEDLRDVVPHERSHCDLTRHGRKNGSSGLGRSRELGRCDVLADLRKATTIHRPVEAIWGLLIRFCG